MGLTGLSDVLEALHVLKEQDLSTEELICVGDLFDYTWDQKQGSKLARAEHQQEQSSGPKEKADTTIIEQPKLKSLFAPVPLIQVVEYNEFERPTESTQDFDEEPIWAKAIYYSNEELPAAPAQWNPSKIAPELDKIMALQVRTHGIDTKKLVKSLSKLKPLSETPRLYKRRTAQKIHVIIEDSWHLSPAKSDAELVVRWFKRWGPYTKVTRGPSDWPQPEPLMTTVVVGDAGLYKSHASNDSWKVILQSRQKMGERMVLLWVAPSCRTRLKWDRVIDVCIKDIGWKESLEKVLILASITKKIEASLLRSLRILVNCQDSSIEILLLQRSDIFHRGTIEAVYWKAEKFVEYRDNFVKAACEENSWLSVELFEKLLKTIEDYRKTEHGFIGSEEAWYLDIASWSSLVELLPAVYKDVFERFKSRYDYKKYIKKLCVSLRDGTSAINRELCQSWFDYNKLYDRSSTWQDQTGVFYHIGAELSASKEVKNIQITQTINGLSMNAVGSPIAELKGIESALLAVEYERSLFTQNDLAIDLSTWPKPSVNSSPKPSWATRSGIDSYGLWAEVDIEEVSFRMRFIKPGTFMMGSPDSDKEADDDEMLREVTITQGYWMADTPCTQALWSKIMKENPSGFKGPQRPVENISWDDIQTFLSKLNEQIPDLELKLPTEAQWEYACRAGSVEPRYGKLDDIAWYDDNSQDNTHDVQGKQLNAWGLYDTLGNVWEWCSDWYASYDSADVIDPIGPAEGDDRVLRGGSWSHIRSSRACSLP